MDILPKILTIVSVSLLAKQMFTIFVKLKQCKFIDREINEVLVFYEDRLSCGKPIEHNCIEQTCAKHTFNKIIRRIDAAVVSIDLCIYVICCPKLIQAIVRAHHRGVSIRLITDVDGVTSARKLYLLGIPIRFKKTGNMMHHKFCLVDGVKRREQLLQTNNGEQKNVVSDHKDGLVMYGSMNWTDQATSGNYESLILTNDATIVMQFERIFFNIWEDFEPEPPLEVQVEQYNDNGHW